MAEGDPGHVAFIMDGNGRWAEARGKSRIFGHRAGAETVRRVTTHARRRGIPYLTLYAFSTENWSRPRAEVEALMLLLGRYLESELPTLRENDVRLNHIGDADGLSTDLRKRLRSVMDATAGNRSLTLTLAINYGGRDEIVRAARRAAADGGVLDEKALAARLDTAGLPDPDLVIRTAGEKRLSNFLIWQAAYAEFIFSPKTWPEFGDEDFDTALSEYRTRTRKFGGA
jgi:undecaprenyl diphosphate synthase